MREYRFRFYINARHSIKINGSSTRVHPHTWEVVLFLRREREEFIQFTHTERDIKAYLSQYEGQLLNEIKPFDTIDPTMENIGEEVYKQVSEMLSALGWDVGRLEISENPTRTYIIQSEDYSEEQDSNIDASDKVIYLDGKRGANATFVHMTPREIRIAGVERIILRVLKLCARMEQDEKDEEVSSAALGVIRACEKLIVRERVNEKMEGVLEAIANEPAKTSEISDSKENIGNDVLKCPELNSDLCKDTEISKYEPSRDEYADDLELQQLEALDEVAVIAESGMEAARDVNEKVKGLKSKKANVFYLIFSGIFFVLAAILLMFYINLEGNYPWGSDTWGHLFKGHLLYNEIAKGNLLPGYTSLWYNGLQPFRYFAPMPYYILYLCELMTGGNTVAAYNLFLVFTFVVGAFGWSLWGVKSERRVLGFILALLWFFLPENIRVLFSEGNISRVVVTVLFPYLLLAVHSYVERKSRWSALAIFLLMFLTTLSHAMIAAMVGLTLFVYAIWYGWAEKKLWQSVQAVACALFGTAFAGIWLYPALKGGIVSFEQEDVGRVMEYLTYPLLQTINPLTRFKDIELFYFGASVLLICILGALFAERKSKGAFIFSLLVLLGTSKELLGILAKVPMNQFLWMMRFTPLALGVFFAGIFYWKKLKKWVLVVFILLLIADSAVSFKLLGHNRQAPVSLQKTLDMALNTAVQRIAVLDASEFASFPTYYISYGSSAKAPGQVFGWHWQGAKTSPNIVWLNTALEKSWYSFLFDRCLELGADTLVVKREKIKDIDSMFAEAAKRGYVKQGETESGVIFKYPVTGGFASTVDYEGFAVGKYASNIAYIFPKFEVGGSTFIDDYSIEELQEYKALFLSGFKYRNKEKAERMIRDLSEKGMKVLIDLTGTESELLSSRQGFLGVLTQPVTFKEGYPELTYGQEKIDAAKLPEGYQEWRTHYLENLENTLGSIDFNKQVMDFLGTRYNDHIYFIGLNLPFYVLETRDKHYVEMLESILGLNAYDIPRREIVDMNETVKSSGIHVKVQQAQVITGIADVDSMVLKSGKYVQRHNLMYMESEEMVADIKYPYLISGIIVSVIGLIGFVGVNLIMHRKPSGV